MKFSDALMAGACLTKPATGHLISEDDGEVYACALGAALIGAVGEDRARTIVAAEEWTEGNGIYNNYPLIRAVLGLTPGQIVSVYEENDRHSLGQAGYDPRPAIARRFAEEGM